MKILLSSDSYKHQINGIANATILLTNELRRKGHEVKVLSLSERMESYKDGDDYYLSSVSSLVYPDLRISLKVNDGLIRELIEWRPDIVHIQTEFSARLLALAVVKETGSPVVMTYNTDYEQFVAPYFFSKRLLKKMSSQFFRKMYKHTGNLIAPSEKAKEILENYGLHQAIAVIPNGIVLPQTRINSQKKNRLLKKLGLKSNGRLLVTVSRISQEKNIDELIDYMPELVRLDSSIHLLIVGGGPHLKKLQKKVSKLHLKEYVVFSGAVNRSIVDEYYQLGDVFVCASTFETQGLTYIEAMSNGLPLICRRDKCLLGVVDEGRNGFLYSTREEYCRQVIGVLHNRKLRRAMGQYSLQKAPSFSKQSFVDNIEKLYAQIIQQQKQKKKTDDFFSQTLDK